MADSDRTVHGFSVWLASPPNAAPREYTPAPFKVKGWNSPNYLQFSPDGRQLLLANWTDAGDSAIWLLPFPDGGSQPHRLFPKMPRIGRAARADANSSWMPDSQRAVMVFPTASAPKGGLWMTDVRTGAATPLSVGLTQQSSPSMSPDGSKVAFTAGGPGYDLVGRAAERLADARFPRHRQRRIFGRVGARIIEVRVPDEQERRGGASHS